MDTLHELERSLTEAGLQNYFNAVRPLAKNAVRLHPAPGPENGIPIGASKLGGCPDLPAGTAWPRRPDTGLPLSFVCQLNYAEFKPYDVEDRLPDRGILYLFYDYSEDGMPWGFDPEDSAGWAVRYYDCDPGILARTEVPEDLAENGAIFAATGLRFSARMELPNWESSLCEGISLSEQERDRLFDWLDENAEDGAAIYKVLGHSDNIQGGMELECEIIAHGLSTGDGSGYKQAQELNLGQFVGRWTLLLQIDSSDELGMDWGDCGRIYLWITEQDLAARAFERSWLILQCY